MAYTPAQGVWRWYSDATPDGSMTALAAENTAPTISGTDMQNGILRLRVQLNNPGTTSGSSALQLQYRDNTASSFTSIEGQTPATNKQGIWFRYANGAATSGGTLGTLLLTGSTTAGTYVEAASVSQSVNASGKTEVDFAVKIHWPPPDDTITFQLFDGTSAIALDTGASAITINTSAAVDRPNSVVRLDGDALQKTTREVRFASWRRIFYDPVGARWWLFTVQYNTPTVMRSYYWSGSGAWTAGATFTSANNLFQTRHAFDYAVTGTGITVYSHHGSSATTRRLNRGTIAGTTLTWGTEASLTQSTDRHTHMCVDDSSRVFVGGTTASTGIWVRRNTATDTVGGTWDAVDTAADTALVSGDIFTMIGIGSDKIMCLWRASTATAIKYSILDAGTMSAAANATTTAAVHPEDWGVVRDGNNVYLLHSDSTSAGGNWVLRVYDITAGTWATGTSPAISGQPSTSDGLPLSVNSGTVYAFGTFNGSESGQDRKIGYATYTGGTSGTWSGLTYFDTGGRVNSDHISTTSTGAGGKIVVLSAANDDDTNPSNSRTIEYFTITTAGNNWTASETATTGLTDTTAYAVSPVADDPTGLTDTQALAQAKVTTETTGLTDTATVGLVYAVSSTDATGLTDTSTVSQGWGVPATDTTGLTDTQVFSQAKVNTDTTGLTDTTATAQAKVVSDPTGLTDTAGLTVAPVNTDDSGLLDEVSINLQEATTPDPVGLTDTPKFDIAMVVTETTGLTDTNQINASGAQTVTATDTTGLTDTTATTQAKVVTETTGLTDSFSIQVPGNISATYDDTTGLADTVALSVSEVYTDTTGLTDTVAKTASQVAAEALGLTDATAASQGKSQADTGGLTDAQVYAQFKGIVEVSGLADSYDLLVTSPNNVNYTYDSAKIVKGVGGGSIINTASGTIVRGTGGGSIV